MAEKSNRLKSKSCFVRRPSESEGGGNEVLSPMPDVGLLGRLKKQSGQKEKEGKKVITYDRHDEEDIREQVQFNDLFDQVKLRVSKQTHFHPFDAEAEEEYKSPLMQHFHSGSIRKLD